MNQAEMTQVRQTSPAPTPNATPSSMHDAGPVRLYYLPLSQLGRLSDCGTVLDHVASLGFTHVLTSPPFDGPEALLPASFAKAHPALQWDGDATAALHHLAAACQTRGLVLWLDVILDQVAADGELAHEAPHLFAHADPAAALDPRHAGPSPRAAMAHLESQALALADWWAIHLTGWRDAGVAGFRLMASAECPPGMLRRLIAAVRQSGPCDFAYWTPGLAAEAVSRLRGSGLDYVFSSLPWWDFRADWLWHEAARLRAVAPILAATEAPFGSRLAASLPDSVLRLIAASRMIRFAAAFGDGWMLTDGFAHGATRPMAAASFPRTPAAEPANFDLSDEVTAANARPRPRHAARLLTSPGAACHGFLRTDGITALLTLANADLTRRHGIDLGAILTQAGAGYRLPEGQPATVHLTPGAVTELELHPTSAITRPTGDLAATAAPATAMARIAIEAISPAVDDGRFAAKHVVGRPVVVSADILCDGHDHLAAAVLWRCADDTAWQRAPMTLIDNDRWEGHFPAARVGRHIFTVEAWYDAFATFTDGLAKKHAAGIDVTLELIEGRALVARTAARHANVASLLEQLNAADAAGQIAVFLAPATMARMTDADLRPFATQALTQYRVDVDRTAAEFASWYEIFPRSMSDDPARHGTFADVVRHLPRIRAMGFDVLYFPPIHPIGRSNRKGRNNTLTPADDDPGSPYAIGAAEGGHSAIHPELGDFDDFQALRQAAAEHGMELALDFAIQCAPDHPWLTQHKGWFDWRPDGSLRYAENPPKKYQDIVNVDFYGPEAVPSLWMALCETVLFWADQGVRIFRVDNPHTKPFPFWQWLIEQVRARYPDTLFLAEAFTRPKIMNRLGKIGFSQSYTYFTWRNTRAELEAYLTDLTNGREIDFFRPNFFVNTPDINPVFLHTSGRPGFLIRAGLAATLSGLWGVYCGFELCEAAALPGREEYLDSEKYQMRAWDWERPGNIVAEIAELNAMRRLHPALQSHRGVTFLPSDNQQVMLFEKSTPDRSSVVVVAISLDPFAPQTSNVELPFWRWNHEDLARVEVDSLTQPGPTVWDGKWQRLTLTPAAPYAIWRIQPNI